MVQGEMEKGGGGVFSWWNRPFLCQKNFVPLDQTIVETARCAAPFLNSLVKLVSKRSALVLQGLRLRRNSSRTKKDFDKRFFGNARYQFELHFHPVRENSLE